MLFTDVLRPRIRTWLMALSFVAMLPLLVFSIYTMDKINETEKQATLRELRRRTQSVALNVEAHINVAAGTLETLGQSEASIKGDVRGLYASAKRALSTDPSFRAISLVNPNGRMFFHTPIPFGNPMFPSFEKEVTQRALETNQLQLTGPFIAPISPKSVVAVTVPITMAGKRDKCLRIIMLTETLDAFLNKQQLPPGWVAGLMNDNGIMLARSREPENNGSKKVSETVLEATHNPEKKIFRINASARLTFDKRHGTHLRGAVVCRNGSSNRFTQSKPHGDDEGDEWNCSRMAVGVLPDFHLAGPLSEKSDASSCKRPDRKVKSAGGFQADQGG